MSLHDAETYLTNKGWQYSEGSEAGEGKMGTAKFVFGSSGDFSFAESFLSIVHQYGSVKRISVQMNKLAKYTEYLNGVKKFAPSPINTKIVDGDLLKIYVGATTTFEFATTTTNTLDGNTKTTWLLFIAENDDYETQFGYY
ncbi:hypothetical protein ACK2M7_01720 [Chryseobacterium sp. TY4]